MEKKEEKVFSWRSVFGMLSGSFQGTRLLYTGTLFFILISSLGQVAEPLIYGRIIDVIVAKVGARELTSLVVEISSLVLFWAVAVILGNAAKEVGQWMSYHAGNTVWHAYAKASLKRVLSWDPERFGRISLGSLAKRLDRSGEASWELGARTLIDIVPTMVTFTVFLVVGVVVDWRMTLASLAVVPFLLFMTLVAYRKADKAQEELNDAWDEVSRKLFEVVSNIVPIKSYVAEDRMLKEYMELIETGLKRQNRLNSLWTLLDFVNGVLRFGARLFTLAAGVYFISEGSLTLGTLVTFLGMMSYILAPFDYLLADILRRTSEAKNAFARLADEWYAPNALTESSRPKRLKDVKGEIVFDEVSYKYRGADRNVLNDISLTIKAGASLAIVGPSGGGKTTLTRFINRFLDPTEGKVLIDGVNVKEAKTDDIRRAIGVVHQDTTLFNESVFENIRFVRPGATREEVIAACKKAQAHEFIERLAKGYDTLVGERGARLSGGERQRLALARVFLADNPILILDESTSALDSETEARLQVALKSAMKGRTTIIIAHRLSTVYMADQIAVIERGRIVELGTHDELLKEGGLYEKLWRLQSGGYLPD